MELAAQFLTISAPAFDILEGILLRRPNFRSAVLRIKALFIRPPGEGRGPAQWLSGFRPAPE